jgi:hypothetical protein
MPRFGGARCAASTGPYVFQGNPPWFGFRQFLFLVRWAAAVAYVLGGEAMVSFHHAMPFGATSSVLAWDQVGDLLCFLCRFCWQPYNQIASCVIMLLMCFINMVARLLL